VTPRPIVLLLCALLCLLAAPTAFAQSFTDTTATLLRSDREPLHMHLWLADEPTERARGLMEVEDFGAYDGMLFDFGEVQRVTMWMKNTPLALDMIFIDAQGAIVHIHRNAEPHSTKLIRSPVDVLSVLELQAGKADEWGITPGDKVEHAIFN